METSKENMEALKALSNINIQISEATNRLIKLQEDETVYLEEREKKALERIDKVKQPDPVVIEKIVEKIVEVPSKNIEHIITTEKMESVKALSEINLKVSEAQNTLFQIQEMETEYLQAREKKALQRIEKVICESGEMVKEAEHNYSQIKELLTGVTEFAHKLITLQNTLNSLLEEFDQRNIEWEKDIGKQQDDITQVRKLIKIEEIQINNDKKAIQTARKKLADDQRKLESDRGTIDRAIQRLKINKK